ncbi:hypothetical protein ACLOJK_034077 [Asimina triloba]
MVNRPRANPHHAPYACMHACPRTPGYNNRVRTPALSSYHRFGQLGPTFIDSDVDLLGSGYTTSCTPDCNPINSCVHAGNLLGWDVSMQIDGPVWPYPKQRIEDQQETLQMAALQVQIQDALGNEDAQIYVEMR